MLERLLENWLDSASERSYQSPFCQMLAAEALEIRCALQRQPPRQIALDNLVPGNEVPIHGRRGGRRWCGRGWRGRGRRGGPRCRGGSDGLERRAPRGRRWCEHGCRGRSGHRGRGPRARPGGEIRRYSPRGLGRHGFGRSRRCGRCARRGDGRGGGNGRRPGRGRGSGCGRGGELHGRGGERRGLRNRHQRGRSGSSRPGGLGGRLTRGRLRGAPGKRGRTRHRPRGRGGRAGRAADRGFRRQCRGGQQLVDDRVFEGERKRQEELNQ